MSGKTIDYRLAVALRAGAENALKTAEKIREELRRIEADGETPRPGTPNEDDAFEWDKDAALIYSYLGTFDEEVLA